MTDSAYEIYEGAKWLEAVMQADTGAGGLFQTGSPMIYGAHMDMVPQGVLLPAIRFHVQSSNTVRGVGRGHASRILTQIDWLIVVMHEGHLVAPLVPIVQRLDTILTGSSGSTSKASILSCEMIEPFQMLETDKSGVQIRHAGGLYRTIVTSP